MKAWLYNSSIVSLTVCGITTRWRQYYYRPTLYCAEPGKYDNKFFLIMFITLTCILDIQSSINYINGPSVNVENCFGISMWFLLSGKLLFLLLLIINGESLTCNTNCWNLVQTLLTPSQKVLIHTRWFSSVFKSLTWYWFYIMN